MADILSASSWAHLVPKSDGPSLIRRVADSEFGIVLFGECVDVDKWNEHYGTPLWALSLNSSRYEELINQYTLSDEEKDELISNPMTKRALLEEIWEESFPLFIECDDDCSTRKTCSCCHEETSCGNYNEDREWVCEDCETTSS